MEAFKSTRALRRLATLALSASVVAFVGCGDDSKDDGLTPDGETPDGGGSDVGGDGGGGGDGGDGGRPEATCLDAAAFSNLVTVESAFPFCVTQVREADAEILGSRWGRRGGPMVTTGVYGGTGGPKVVQWDVSGTATAAATSTEHTFAPASGLPGTFYYGADGMVDLPFGSLSLLSYTGSAAHYPGEALLYSST
jgi:hypothetical protein